MSVIQQGGYMFKPKFKHYQESHNISIRDMCDKLGVSKQMIYYWREYGVRSWKCAQEISSKLKCKVDDILGVICD